MSTRHTPGPWKSSQSLMLISHAERGNIAEVFSANSLNDISQSEAEANARLIAAAPDLLAAAKLALHSLKPIPDLTQLDPNLDGDYACIRLIQAIIKAEGSDK